MSECSSHKGRIGEIELHIVQMLVKVHNRVYLRRAQRVHRALRRIHILQRAQARRRAAHCKFILLRIKWIRLNNDDININEIIFFILIFIFLILLLSKVFFHTQPLLHYRPTEKAKKKKKNCKANILLVLATCCAVRAPPHSKRTIKSVARPCCSRMRCTMCSATDDGSLQRPSFAKYIPTIFNSLKNVIK